jgi:hypothetical protein
MSPSTNHQKTPAPLDTTARLPSASRTDGPLTFPAREVVVEALRVFASNPFGFEPKDRFWREVGVLPTVVSKNTLLGDCLRSGLLLPPGEIFGVPHGYLPGPAAFERGAHGTPISQLPQRPHVEEILHNARARALTLFVTLLCEEGCPTPKRIATFLNLPAGAGSTFLTSLKDAGLITVDSLRIIPTENMAEFLGRPNLVAEVTALTRTFDPTVNNAFKSKRAKADELFRSISEPLKTLIQENPGRTTHELFSLAQASGTWLPPEVTKAVFTGWLDKLVAQSILTRTRQRQGPVRFVELYHVAENKAAVPNVNDAPTS